MEKRGKNLHYKKNPELGEKVRCVQIKRAEEEEELFQQDAIVQRA